MYLIKKQLYKELNTIKEIIFIWIIFTKTIMRCLIVIINQKR
ncbi:hypothetical protein HMPREF9726_01983 [Treponema denticola H-22]|uniref:Uncharacterized protein n=1 Tax=Treponema denticola H-22 TaxID=999432 RepID=A0A0E2E4D6_TREDN|nr:hypothetical protein HMPREF9726_01983 [Treponema denticola H-22]